MSLRLFNTSAHALEPLRPLQEGRVGLYICGPTVYDHAHVGHARAAVAFDVLVRRLLALGYQVDYVRNYTDIDDKIINRARESGQDWRELGEAYIKSFDEDMEALGCLRPTHAPKATDYIEQMRDDVSAIIDRGYAYAAGGDVFFDVSAYQGYGRLSGRQTEDQEAGARVAVDERKRHPADFALWKAAKPGEPSWPSPWGPGRPGWHIECSTMSARLLGPAFDIHGGGQDLIFPHHENELAQSGALGRPMAAIWAHNGFVNINHEKMSKSLGNFFTIKDVLKLCHPEVLRFFLVSRHYRAPIEFSDEALKEAGRALERVYRAIEAAEALLGEAPGPGAPSEEAARLAELFSQAMDEDLNTAQAMGHVFELARLLNRQTAAGERGPAAGSLAILKGLGEQLALWRRPPAEFFAGLKSQGGGEDAVAEIEGLIVLRSQARASKDWAEADRLRQLLDEKGVIVEDKAGQSTWRFA
jgi:cysteinyl-tRNA synthetase